MKLRQVPEAPVTREVPPLVKDGKGLGTGIRRLPHTDIFWDPETGIIFGSPSADTFVKDPAK